MILIIKLTNTRSRMNTTVKNKKKKLLLEVIFTAPLLEKSKTKSTFFE